MSALLSTAALLASLSLQGKPVSFEQSPERSVVFATLHGPVDVTMAARVHRALREARSLGAKTLIFEIDSEGGEVDKMWQIARPLTQEKEIETIAFVDRKAISAAAVISVACSKVYMTPSASIGAATPVKMDPTGQLLPVSEDPDVKGKFYAAFRADFRAIAEARGKNPAIAEAMVDPNIHLQKVSLDGEARYLKAEEVDELLLKGEKVVVLETVKSKGEPLSLTADLALKYGFIDGRADSREELLRLLSLDRARLVEILPSWSEDLVRWLHGFAPLLLILGLLLGYLEFKLPGFGIPGILSIACFLLLFFGNYLVGLAEIFHVVIFGLGIALILVELFVFPGTLVFGIAGFLAVVYGLVASFLGFYWPEHQLDFETLRMTGELFVKTLAVFLAAAFTLSWILSKYLAHIPFFGKRLVMPVEAGSFQGSAAPITEMASGRYLGKSAVAATDLRPAGKVEIDGMTVDAQSHGAFIPKGTRVRVVEVSSNRIVVEPETS